MSILKKMLVRLPVKKSYLRMAWDATAKGQNELALQLFKMAYEQETDSEKKAEAAWNVYVDYKNKEKYHEAYLWCERTARFGFVKAMRILGKAYYYGLGVIPNYRLAAKWFKAGADKSDPTCIRLLGECYIHGKGVLPNMSKAYSYFKTAYDMNEPGSYYWMGLAYRYGAAGIEVDIQKALNIWLDGQNNSRCLCELGKCYYWGCGLAKDKDLAYKYFKMVSDRGKDFADNYLTYDKSGLVDEDKVEELSRYSDIRKIFSKSPEEGMEAALEGQGHPVMQ